MIRILNSIVTLLVALLGIPAGYLLGIIAKEELSAGKKYFNFAQHLIFIIIVLLISYFYWYFIFVILILLLEKLYDKKIKNRLMSLFIFELLKYLVLATSFFILNNQSFNLLLASLIFIYSLVLGTNLHYYIKK